MIATILNFNPKDRQSIEQFALANFEDHQEIRQAIIAAGGPNLTVWDIYPLDLAHWDVWASKHQSAHNEMNSASGLSGSDISQLKFDNPADVENWMYRHFREHTAQRTKYGI